MNKPKNTITIVLFALAAVLLILRFVRLGIDPPYFFAGFTQAHLTDPYHLTLFARNAVLFDDWNPFDYHRWDVFKYSLVSGMSYIMFLLFGVSRITANLVGLLLNITGLTFFVLGFRKYRSLKEILLMSVFLLASSMLIFYGRLPFLENGLIALAGLTFFIFTRFHDRRWGPFAAGFIIAAAAFSGKLFGFILLGPVIITLFYIYRSRAVIPSLVAIAGTIAGTIAHILVFYGGSLSVMYRYYSEQTVGLYGTPTAFLSPLCFLAKAVTFGSEAGFFKMSPFLTVLAILGILVLILKNRLSAKVDRELVPVVFCIAWLVCGLFGLMPFNYRPLRYQVFLLLPIAALSGYIVHLAAEGSLILSARKRILAMPALFFSLWYISTQVWLLTVPLSDSLNVGYEIAPLTAVIALIVTTGIWILIGKRRRELSQKALLIVLVPLALGVAVKQGTLIYQGLTRPGYNLKALNKEIAEMVDQNAVLSGPYAPAFSIDNNLRVIIHVFGLSIVDRYFFDRYPITHMVADHSNWKLAKEQFPFLESSLSLRRVRIRDGSVELFRVPGRDLPFSLYEQAALAFGNRQYDSALVYSRRFTEKYPDNLSGQFGRLTALFIFGDNDHLQRELETLVARYPDNFRVHMFCRDSYGLMYKATGSEKYRRLKEYHLKRAKEINPAKK